MTVLDILNARLKDDTISEVDKLLAIEEIEEVIKSYCNIDNIPKALKFTWANMAIDLLRYQVTTQSTPSTEASAGGVDFNASNTGNISSVKIGDTNISFSSGDNSLNALSKKSHQANLDDLILNYKEQLQRYRRMTW